MDISLGTLLHYLWGFFQFTHSQPFPHPHLTNNFGRVYLQFFFRGSTLYRVGARELQESFDKDALFYEGTRK